MTLGSGLGVRGFLAQALELAFEAAPEPVGALARLGHGLGQRRGQALAQAVDLVLQARAGSIRGPGTSAGA